MTNILNSIIANQPIYPAQQDNKPVFTFDSDGKIKPLKGKGKLLPSRVFGSPIEYVKDLKQDIVNIGRAAKGQANDHELGRINDVAMKLGSLGLASYLFVKNPLKLSKAMEFVGFGTFFASMALWPKLAIQAPLKARTGVDIHQKYIDSQGRKKMLYQDPQYVLTDMYTREDLDRIGKKLGVSENLPDRDNFIKQRAQKTALQGNTLWMMTAGVATPVMSALACNALEKPVGELIQRYDLKSTERALENGAKIGIFDKLKMMIQSRRLDRFLTKNADKPLDASMIRRLSGMMGKQASSLSLNDVIGQELSGFRTPVDSGFVRETLKSIIPDSVISSLSGKTKETYEAAVASKNFGLIARILSVAAEDSERQQTILSGTIEQTLKSAYEKKSIPTVSQFADKIKAMHASVADFAARHKIIGRFLDVRAGVNAGSYKANQWNKIADKFIKSLHLSSKELRKVADGDMSVIERKMQELAGSKDFDSVIATLSKLISGYDSVTGSLMQQGGNAKVVSAYEHAVQALIDSGSEGLAEKAKTIARNTSYNASQNALGAKATVMRLLQTLDLQRQISQGSYRKTITSLLRKNNLKADDATIQKLIEASKKIMMSASITDYTEKIKGLSDKEFKIVMEALFRGRKSEVEQSIQRTMGATGAKGIIDSFRAHKEKVVQDVVNWQNTITPELSRRVASTATNGTNAESRNNLIGGPVKETLQNICKKAYNSKKWMKIFGGTMIALTAATLIAGLFIGRKGKTEKQVEAENKKNV